MAADSAKLMPGGGGMPPGVVLCAYAAPATASIPQTNRRWSDAMALRSLRTIKALRFGVRLLPFPTKECPTHAENTSKLFFIIIRSETRNDSHKNTKNRKLRHD